MEDVEQSEVEEERRMGKTKGTGAWKRKVQALKMWS
jgi:hypothetical protein